MDRRVRVPKTAELISERLRREIIMGVLKEDDALPPEKELMEEFGVSRPTLREAFRILESEGLIEVRRGANGGGRVRAPHLDNVARHAGLLLQFGGVSLGELFDARTRLEAPCAAALAVRRSGEDVDQLRDLIGRAGRALQRLDQDQANVVELQHQFHERVVRLAGNRAVDMLASVVDSVLNLANAQHAEGRLGTTRMRRSFELVQEAHTRMVDLIEQGDAEGAEALWRAHLDAAAAIVLNDLGAKSLVELFT